MFIELTSTDNSPMMFNINNIMYFFPMTDGSTKIRRVDGNTLDVLNPYDEIKIKIAEALKGIISFNEVYRF